MKRQLTQKQSHKKMRGFEYLLRSALSFALLLVNVLIPVYPALVSADEIANEAPPAAVEEVIVIPEETSEPSEVSEEEEIVQDVEVAPPVIDEEIASGVEVTPPLTNENVQVVLPVEENQPVAVDEEVLEEEANPLPDTLPLPEDSATTTSPSEVSEEEGSSIEGEIEDTTGTTTEEIPSDDVPPPSDPVEEEETDIPSEPIEEEQIDEEVIEENETEDGVPEEIEPTVVAVNTLTNDESRFMFGQNECASVGDGSYYCSETTPEPEVAGTDRVFSAVDNEGDREIYVEKGGDLVAITDNYEEDDAPYYDEVSDSIVWQRLVDGRYQVVSYDLEESKETLLTNDRFNNMEPMRHGNVTVWQAWVGNDWEIMMRDEEGVTMITDNTHNDIAPHINGTYIIWQAFESDSWKVKVYDTLTKKIETIDATEGASVENPRFVLVYDAKQPNGDVETKGYDLKSKKNVPLSASPATVPEEIPDPEQTGEDRALVSPNVQLKPKNESDQDPAAPVPVDDEPASDESDPVLPGDVVIPSLPESASSTPSVEGDAGALVEIPTPEHIDDLIIPLPEVPETVTPEGVEDLVVPVFVPSLEVSDPQTGVASST